MVVMYEGLVNKLTEQNGKLKATIKQNKKARKKSLKDTKQIMKKYQNGLNGKDQSIFDIQLTSLDRRSQKSQ